MSGVGNWSCPRRRAGSEDIIDKASNCCLAHLDRDFLFSISLVESAPKCPTQTSIGLPMSNAPFPAETYFPDTLDAGARIATGQESSMRTAQDDLDILRVVVEGTASSTGEAFFQDLVRHLAAALDVPFAAISEFSDVNTRVRTLAFWADRRIQDNFEYDLDGTPCEEVMRGKLCHFPEGVKTLFPHAKPLVPLKVESYLGTPLLDGDGKVLGLLAVFDTRPMPAQPRHLYLLRIFAARVAAVLERLRAERRLSASERRFRDLYEEAPVGYLSLSVDGRILSANHRAGQMIGFSLEELEGLPIAKLFDDPAPEESRNCTPRPRFVAGEELAGLEVKTRRKDGQCLWISLWMRPIRDGNGQVQASRLIWVDITDRILAEAERARLVQQNHYLQDEIKDTHNFEELIGQSLPLQAVLDKVQCRPDRRHRANHRRNRYGQGTYRPRDSFRQQTPGQAFDQDKLRGLLAWAGGKRTVRSREGRLHTRHRTSYRPF